MKKILLAIDCQYDFLEGGSLGVNGATEKMNKLVSHIENNEYDFIVFTVDWHPINHCSFVENGGVWPSHCVQHTHGAAIYQPLINSAIGKTKSTIKILTKGDVPSKEEYSIMGNYHSSKQLIRLINDENIEQIDVVGIANEYCVKNTVEDLVKCNLKDKLNVLFDFIAAINDENVLKNYVSENGLKSV